MDAVDGKHARRIGQTSPLGQLFDHGCDANSTILSYHLWAQALQFGKQPIFFVIITCLSTNYMTGQFQEYYTHVLDTNFAGIIGVTEIETITYVSIIANAATGYRINELLLQDIFPATFLDFLPFDKNAVYTFKLLNVFGVVAVIASISTSISHFWGAFSHASQSWLVTLYKAFPVYQWWGVLFCTYGCTDFAWDHPSLVMVGLCPIFSLLN